MNLSPRVFLFSALAAFSGWGCFGSSPADSATQSATKGPFEALSANMSDGDIWALNRPIRFFFNHPIDMASVNFSSIIIRPTSSAILGRPVAGTFEVSSFDNKELLFYPACPIVEEEFYPGFFPGGYGYELALPVEDGNGSSVLRDIAGKPLEVGLSRNFVTPTPPSEPLFIDTEIGPPQVVDVYWTDAANLLGTQLPNPTKLNMFSMSREVLVVRFDQAVDGNPSNLNTTNLSLAISDDTITNQPSSPTFSTDVPGVLTLLSNCDGGGALVHFKPSGVLPPDRYLRFTVGADFEDLSGDKNTASQETDFELPTLAEVYGNPGTWTESDVTADEFTEDFGNLIYLDLEAPLGLPLATVDTSGATASFDYPGELVSGDENFVLATGIYLEVNTTGTSTIEDSQGRTFDLEGGILEVNDFTLQAGSTFRGVGSNPLIIRANGTVSLDGTLDVSGKAASPPLALNSPHLPELGAEGECGGGDGGDASSLTASETLRGEAGDGPFGLYPLQGGGGGESGFQQGVVDPTTYPYPGPNGELPADGTLEHWIVGGGGGGGFGLGPNASVTWRPVAGEKAGWSSEEWPSAFDNDGPDHRPGWHTAFDTDPTLIPEGAEPGLRGSSYDSSTAAASGLAGTPVGVYGMEDLTQDDTQDDNTVGFDPAFTDSANPPTFDTGNPTAGPDAGAAGTSPFTDGDTSNDFYGRRFDPSTGLLIEGELLSPWAGSGGGASGDLQHLARDNDGGDPMAWVDLSLHWPDPLFPHGVDTLGYFKGAPGGGGGGQLQIHAVGPIIIGANGLIKANGGMGNGGENVRTMGTQVSGSGGGSGGHIILQSATGLDLDAIEMGSGSNVALLPEVDVIQAIGGRRGWAMPQLNPDATVGAGVNALRNDWDGNSQFMVGRGGAGGNGVIQIHVPRPEANIAFDPEWSTAIQNFIVDGSGNLEVDSLEEILDQYTAPASVSLIPFFAGESNFQSAWVDTGILGLRDPDSLGGWPKFGDSVLSFSGTDQDDNSGTSGNVLTAGGEVAEGATLLTGTLGVSGSTSGYSFVLSGAATLFATAGKSQFVHNAGLLEGYDLEIDGSTTATHGIADAVYDSSTDRLVLSTNVLDGIPASSGTWTLREKFFRITTSDTKDRLPDTATVRMEFQGAPEGATPNLPDEAAATAWTTELTSELEGMRFFRYRVTFNISANSASLSLGSERPRLESLKIPFAW